MYVNPTQNPLKASCHMQKEIHCPSCLRDATSSGLWPPSNAISCWPLLALGPVTLVSWLFLEHTKNTPVSRALHFVFSDYFHVFAQMCLLSEALADHPHSKQQLPICIQHYLQPLSYFSLQHFPETLSSLVDPFIICCSHGNGSSFRAGTLS